MNRTRHCRSITQRSCDKIHLSHGRKVGSVSGCAGDGLRREFRSGSDTAVGGRRNLNNHVVAFQTIDPGLGRKVLVEVEIGGCGALPYGTARRLTRSASTTIPIFRSK
jgi:hypothetical protein